MPMFSFKIDLRNTNSTSTIQTYAIFTQIFIQIAKMKIRTS